jgi:hypothetical protein
VDQAQANVERLTKELEVAKDVLDAENQLLGIMRGDTLSVKAPFEEEIIGMF